MHFQARAALRGRSSPARTPFVSGAAMAWREISSFFRCKPQACLSNSQRLAVYQMCLEQITRESCFCAKHLQHSSCHCGLLQQLMRHICQLQPDKRSPAGEGGECFAFVCAATTDGRRSLKGLVGLGGRVRRELARKRMPGQALHNKRYGQQQ